MVGSFLESVMAYGSCRARLGEQVRERRGNVTLNLVNLAEQNFLSDTLRKHPPAPPDSRLEFSTQCSTVSKDDLQETPVKPNAPEESFPFLISRPTASPTRPSTYLDEDMQLGYEQ